MKKIYSTSKTILLAALFTSIHFIVTAQNWTQQISNTTEDLNAVHFLNANVGGSVGFNGTIVTTTNGGTTWTPQTSGVTANLFDIFFIDAQTAYAAGFGGTILKSINGGSTWSPQTSGTTQILYDVFFVSPLIGWVVGSSGTILNTIDGGTTWTPQAGMNTDFKAVFFISPTEGWAVGLPLILHTTNAGATWSIQTAPNANYYDIHFINANEGWAVGTGTVVVKTIDGGITWNSITIPLNLMIYAVHFVSPAVGYINVGTSVTSGSSLRKTTDGGLTFPVEPTGVNANTTDAHFINAGLGWVVGYDGIILKFSGPVGINDLENESGFSVFPIPANQSLVIIHQSLKENCELKMFDVLGKEIMKSEVRSDKTEIDVSKFENGIYFVKIQSENKTATQKLIIQH